jgi:hypothetical protein
VQPSSCGNGAVQPRPMFSSLLTSKGSLRYLAQSTRELWVGARRDSPRGTRQGHMKNFYMLPIVQDSSCRRLSLNPQEAAAS